jgi:hypothetical protein
MKLNYEFRKKIQAVLLLVNTVLLLLLWIQKQVTD